jgi:hypothetical protein
VSIAVINSGSAPWLVVSHAVHGGSFPEKKHREEKRDTQKGEHHKGEQIGESPVSFLKEFHRGRKLYPLIRKMGHLNYPQTQGVPEFFTIEKPGYSNSHASMYVTCHPEYGG